MALSRKKILCIVAPMVILSTFLIIQNTSGIQRQLLIAKIRSSRTANFKDKEVSFEKNLQTSNNLLPTLDSLRNWSIRNKYLPEMDPLIEPHREKLPDSELNKEFPILLSLRRPGSKNIISRFKTGPRVSELNPRDSYQGIIADYGPIPTLELMTCREAESLWGDGKNGELSQNYDKSFELVSNDYLSPDKAAFLDVSFENNHIKKYRLRTSSYQSPWHKVGGEWSNLTILLLGSFLTAIFLLKVRF